MRAAALADVDRRERSGLYSVQKIAALRDALNGPTPPIHGEIDAFGNITASIGGDVLGKTTSELKQDLARYSRPHLMEPDDAIHLNLGQDAAATMDVNFQTSQRMREVAADPDASLARSDAWIAARKDPAHDHASDNVDRDMVPPPHPGFRIRPIRW
jgi:hypothetical protein